MDPVDEETRHGGELNACVAAFERARQEIDPMEPTPAALHLLKTVAGGLWITGEWGPKHDAAADAILELAWAAVRTPPHDKDAALAAGLVELAGTVTRLNPESEDHERVATAALFAGQLWERAGSEVQAHEAYQRAAEAGRAAGTEGGRWAEGEALRRMVEKRDKVYGGGSP